MVSEASDVRTTLTASAALITGVLPVFLIGALSDAIREELGLGEAAIGAAVTVLLGTAGVAATMAGRATDRLGAAVTLRLGVIVAGSATATVGLVAQRWWHIAVPFAAVGVAIGLIDTGAARTFAERIRPARQGLAFGSKEASVPSASLLAGLALPTLAAALGWRATFVGALGVAVLVLVSLPRRTSPHDAATAARDRASSAMTSRGAIVLFAFAVGLGAGAATAGATFLVPTGTAYGLRAPVAGAVLAVASLASIGARVATGWWADRPRMRPAWIITWMLVAGAGGAILVASEGPAVVIVGGAVLALGAGWGWTGLAFFAAVRARPTAPAAAAGVVLTGLGIGGALGPVAFGALVEAGSYRVAWAATAGAMLFAAVLAGSTTSALLAPAAGVPGGAEPPARRRRDATTRLDPPAGGGTDATTT